MNATYQVGNRMYRGQAENQIGCMIKHKEIETYLRRSKKLMHRVKNQKRQERERTQIDTNTEIDRHKHRDRQGKSNTQMQRNKERENIK